MVLCSKRAREERAAAAEQRIQALLGEASSSSLPMPPAAEDDSGSEGEGGDFETDYDRRRTLLEVIEEKDLDALRATALDLGHDFLLPGDEFPGVCGNTSPCDSTAAGPSKYDFTDSGTSDSQTKTSPNDPISARPEKKRKTSQSKLTFTSHITPTVTEATKGIQDDWWNCIVCTL